MAVTKPRKKTTYECEKCGDKKEEPVFKRCQKKNCGGLMVPLGPKAHETVKGPSAVSGAEPDGFTIVPS